MSTRQIQFIRKIYTLDSDEVNEVIADTQIDIGEFLIYKIGKNKVKELNMVIGADVVRNISDKGMLEMDIIFTINASDDVAGLLERDMRLPYLKLCHAN
ncbi:MAG: hypothetical protein GF411_14095 [Candidatus Lokiarchaeota archaeon]|nr:hypothetical protein [Candidatus Lokiarchaeota archaeon]